MMDAMRTGAAMHDRTRFVKRTAYIGAFDRVHISFVVRRVVVLRGPSVPHPHPWLRILKAPPPFWCYFLLFRRASLINEFWPLKGELGRGGVFMNPRWRLPG